MTDPNLDDIKALSRGPETFGVPLAVLGNIGPVIRGINGSPKLAQAITIAVLAVGSAYACLKEDLSRILERNP